MEFLDSRRMIKTIMQAIFREIEKSNFNLSFDECLERANKLKDELLNKHHKHEVRK